MICPTCGTEVGTDMFCSNCGTRMPSSSSGASAPAPAPAPAHAPTPAPSYSSGASYAPPSGGGYAPSSGPSYSSGGYAPPAAPVTPTYNTYINVTPDSLPPQYRPLSAWAYFGLSILFSIPIVGFVFLIVFSFSSANINRRSYARSYFCLLLLVVIVLVILLACGVSLGFLSDIFD